QENKNRENTRRVVPVETTTSNALVSCDGYDWSDQLKEGPTNFTLMAYSSTSSNFEVSNDSNCSSSCLEIVKILKEQNEQLLKDLRTSKLNAIACKTSLESVEARLLVYKKNGSVYEEDIKVLKREIHLREIAITELRRKFRVNVVPPPYTGNFMPPKPDLSFSGLEEFTNEPVVIKPIVETSEARACADKPKAVRKNNSAPIIKDWVSDSEEENVSQTKIKKKTAKSSFAKIEFVKSKEQVKSPRKTTVKQAHSTIKRPIHKNTSFKNSNFNERVNAVKDKNVNVVRPKAVINVARPKAVFNAIKGNNVNAVKASACISKLVMAWVPSDGLGPQKRLIFLPYVQGNPQQDLEEKGVIESGCSRNMTGNMSYLTDFEEIDGGYVALDSKSSPDAGFKPSEDDEKKVTKELGKKGGDSSKEDESDDQEKDNNVNNTINVNTASDENSTNNVNAVSSTVNAAGIEVNAVGAKISIELLDDPNMPALEDIVYSDDDEDVGAEANMNNLDAFMPVSPILTTKVNKDHPVEQIIGDLNSAPQTRRMIKNLEEHGFV
ncbi:hypothetical protein Tco_1109788, partial [Tanacetum coccineum]